MKTKITFLFLFTIISLPGFSQENKKSKVNCSVGTDLVSSYLWRGYPQGNAPAIQPWTELSFKGFSIGAWGSFEFTGNFKEIDVYAKYTYKWISLQFVDLFFPDYPGLDQNYFNFKNSTTGHASELGLSFNGTEKIPVSVFAGMIMYGTPIDHSVSDTNKLNRSMYFEVNYLGNAKDFSYNVFAGFTPTSSVLYGTTGFSAINLGASVKKSIKITESFSLPLKLTLAANPVSKKLHLAFILSL
jgi:hypothetical protein